MSGFVALDNDVFHGWPANPLAARFKIDFRRTDRYDPQMLVDSYDRTIVDVQCGDADTVDAGDANLLGR